MKKIGALLLVIGLLGILKSTAQIHNKLTKNEHESGWKLLFNGTDLNGWHSLTGSGWVVKQGELLAVPSKTSGQKDLLSEGTYDYFDLYFEFKADSMTNSGLKYWVSTDYSDSKNAYLGLEYQILDNAHFVYPERGELRTTGSLYDMIPAASQHSIRLGEWNSARIVVEKNAIQHWLNGKMLLEFDPQTDAFRSLVMQSKYKNFKKFGHVRTGSILLQNEGTAVTFRTIKIKELIR